MVEAAEGVFETCGWCGKAIPEGTPVYASGIKVQNPGALAGKVGQFVQVIMLNVERTFLAIVPSEDSDARKKGYDAVVMVCGKRCRNRIKKAASLPPVDRERASRNAV
jgi:ribosomal protein L2